MWVAFSGIVLLNGVEWHWKALKQHGNSICREWHCRNQSEMQHWLTLILASKSVGKGVAKGQCQTSPFLILICIPFPGPFYTTLVDALITYVTTQNSAIFISISFMLQYFEGCNYLCRNDEVGIGLLRLLLIPKLSPADVVFSDWVWQCFDCGPAKALYLSLKFCSGIIAPSYAVYNI